MSERQGSSGDYPLTDQLHDALLAGQGYLDAKDGLLSYYRSGISPSEAFWRRYSEAEARWTAVKEASHKPSHPDLEA